MPRPGNRSESHILWASAMALDCSVWTQGGGQYLQETILIRGGPRTLEDGSECGAALTMMGEGGRGRRVALAASIPPR